MKKWGSSVVEIDRFSICLSSCQIWEMYFFGIKIGNYCLKCRLCASPLTCMTVWVQMQRLGLLVWIEECMCGVKNIRDDVPTTWSTAEVINSQETLILWPVEVAELLKYSADWERSLTILGKEAIICCLMNFVFQENKTTCLFLKKIRLSPKAYLTVFLLTERNLQ